MYLVHRYVIYTKTIGNQQKKKSIRQRILARPTIFTTIRVQIFSSPFSGPAGNKLFYGQNIECHHSISCSDNNRPVILYAFIFTRDHRIRSIQNDQQAIRDSSVIFVAPYWSYRISCLKVQLAPLAQGADSEKWNIGLDLCKKRRRMERIFEFV